MNHFSIFDWKVEAKQLVSALRLQHKSLKQSALLLSIITAIIVKEFFLFNRNTFKVGFYIAFYRRYALLQKITNIILYVLYANATQHKSGTVSNYISRLFSRPMHLT